MGRFRDGKNFFFSLKETGLANADFFHFDEYYREHEKRGDTALLEKIAEWKPDLVFFIGFYKMPGADADVPELSTFKIIARDLKIPIAVIWGDFHLRAQTEISKVILPYVHLNLVTDSATAVRRIRSTVPTPEKYAYIWFPKDPKIFNNPGKARDIDISYFGTQKKHRMKRINFIKKHIPLTCGGGERAEHLTTEQFADRLQRSKITLSFSRGYLSHVLNARMFEATACGSLVLEQESCEAPIRFIPYVDYVPFTSNADLIKKAHYYLRHDREREKIAQNGYKKTVSLYSAEKFWKFVIDKTMRKDHEEVKNNEALLDPANLSHMPKWKAIKLRCIYSLFSCDVFFRTYSSIIQRANIRWIRYQLHKIRGKRNKKNNTKK
jgi:hypothetical protein